MKALAELGDSSISQPRRRLRGVLVGTVLSVALAVFWAAPAGATWSIVATEPESGRVGVALASCVPAEILGDPAQPLVPVVMIPGATAAVVQGQLNLAAPDLMTDLLETGAEPVAVIEALVDSEFDPLADTRQYAIVDLDGDIAAFSGAELSPTALDRQGRSVSVQGNLLVSADVVDASLASFETSRDAGSALATALAEGLLAGSRVGGDRRCGDQTALFAQLAVADTADGPGASPRVVTVVVADGDGQNPVELLAEAVSQGRLGLIDVGQPRSQGGGAVRVAVGIAALAMVAGGIIAFRQGLGSVGARR